MKIVNCNQCGSDQTKKAISKKDPSFFNGQDLTIVRFLNCGLMYLNPRPRSDEIDRCVARPFCPVAGYLGYGAEMEVYARKAERDDHC